MVWGCILAKDERGEIVVAGECQSEGGKGGFRRAEDGVSHELEKQPKAEARLCSIFKILYVLLRYSSAPDCSADERSRKRQRERAIFPTLFLLSFPRHLFLLFYRVRYLSLRSRGMYTYRENAFPADVCQTIFVLYLPGLSVSLYFPLWFSLRSF